MAFFDKVKPNPEKITDLSKDASAQPSVSQGSPISSDNQQSKVPDSFTNADSNSNANTDNNNAATNSVVDSSDAINTFSGLNKKKDVANSDQSADLGELKSISLPDTEPKELDAGKSEHLLADLAEGAPLQTQFDLVIAAIQKSGGKATLGQVISFTNLSKKVVSYLVRILSRSQILGVYYPTNPFASPVLTLKKQPGRVEIVSQPTGDNKKLIEKYTVTSDFVTADVKIWSIPFENTPIYEVVPHELSPGTKALVFELIEELAKEIPVKFEDISDPRKLMELKQKFYDAAKKALKKAVPDLSEELQKVLAGTILHHSYGLGDMEVMMSDNWLEEIAINGAKEPISVYHRRYGWLKSTKKFNTESDIYNFSSQIGRKVGKQISSLFPIMDAHLLTGDRVAATLFPISTEGGTVTIRRFARNPWTVVHMIDPKNPTMSKEMMSFLWLCVQYELNVMVVGGTASGKTSVLNTLCSLIPPTNRIISIEDTRELSLPNALHWNWVPMASRTKNAEGLGEVSMLDLMVASLRMRPDRIIVGEIRRKEQAEAMFEAMHTGHSVNATMHADTAEQIKRRLTQPPIEIPENEAQALQLVVVQYRDRRRGLRRTLEIAEFLPGSQDEKVDINYLYRWRPRSDTFEKDSQSIRVVEDLNLHTGMTINEIEEDLQQKQDILQWMLDNNIKDVNKVGHIMRIYYKYPKLLVDTINDRGSLKNLNAQTK